MNSLLQYRLPQGRMEVFTNKPQFPFASIQQVHGHSIVTTEQLPQKADGLIQFSHSKKLIPLCIVTADCLPILILGENGHLFLHVGWRGLAQNILQCPELAQISPFYAFIGPSICSQAFEVQTDFKQYFSDSPHFEQKGEKLCFDLQEECKRRISHSFPQVIVEDAPDCTYHQGFLHSYRRNQTAKRNWNVYFPELY